MSTAGRHPRALISTPAISQPFFSAKFRNEPFPQPISRTRPFYPKALKILQLVRILKSLFFRDLVVAAWEINVGVDLVGKLVEIEPRRDKLQAAFRALAEAETVIVNGKWLGRNAAKGQSTFSVGTSSPLFTVPVLSK